ncbi:hypothetical protein ONA92_26945 [Mycobacteroides salmoniphilum]|uniref:hypothetical protein n=1 Tax=Mycobacteroides salmoniphilum TaxID=404941 RepID=UPI003568C8AC
MATYERKAHSMAALGPGKSRHVFLMSIGGDGHRDEHWFGRSPSIEGVLGVLDDHHLPTPAAAVEEFLVDVDAPKPDVGTCNGRTYYLARHPHHRERG